MVSLFFNTFLHKTVAKQQHTVCLYCCSQIWPKSCVKTRNRFLALQDDATILSDCLLVDWVRCVRK